MNIYIYIYMLGTNFFDCSNFNGCDSTSCSLVTCLGNSFKLYISYSEYTDPTIAPNRSLPTDSAFRSKRLIDASLKRLIDASLPRSCRQINFYIIILHGLTCILVYWLSLITHSRLIPIPIGSMVLVYMLTFGVY